MHFTLSDELMFTLILACAFIGVFYMVFRKRGKTFVAAFDRAAMLGGGLFVLGSLVETLAYVS